MDGETDGGTVYCTLGEGLAAERSAVVQRTSVKAGDRVEGLRLGGDVHSRGVDRGLTDALTAVETTVRVREENRRTTGGRREKSRRAGLGVGVDIRGCELSLVWVEWEGVRGGRGTVRHRREGWRTGNR